MLKLLYGFKGHRHEFLGVGTQECLDKLIDTYSKRGYTDFKTIDAMTNPWYLSVVNM